MAKCKWCETDRAVTKSGFCRDCDKMIREDILSKKSRLEELARIVSPSLPDDQKQNICDEVKRIKSDLQVYKDERVPFFKSSISSWVNPVLCGLGLSVQEMQEVISETAGIECEKCGSKDVDLFDMKKSNSARGASFWVLWIVLAFCSCGLALLVLPFFAGAPVKDETYTLAVCKQCGHKWRI